MDIIKVIAFSFCVWHYTATIGICFQGRSISSKRGGNHSGFCRPTHAIIAYYYTRTTRIT